MVKRLDPRDQSGQGVVEYVLMLSVAVFAYLLLAKGMKEAGVAEKLMRPITQDFAAAYRYGHPKAKGPEDGAPEFHPRDTSGGTNFRIFINPGLQ
jgi:hypothetical protein